MNTTITVPLSKLRPGDECKDGSVNVRQIAASAEELISLKASINEHGLLAPLVVIKGGRGVWYVAAGNRRLAALRELADAGQLDSAQLVPVIEIASAREAREVSLAENVTHAALHPVDEFEAYEALAQAGLSDEQIARNYGLTLRAVRQRRALGGLAPEVRAAWREGKVTAEIARAFTLAPDHKTQAKVLKKLAARGGYGLTLYGVRDALAGKERVVRDQDLGLVTLAEYEAAGGKLREDLFSDEVRLLDPALWDRLAAEKVEARCALLREDGWAFALPSSAVPGYWQHELDEVTELLAKVDEGDGSFEALRRVMTRVVPASLRAKSGVVIFEQGELRPGIGLAAIEGGERPSAPAPAAAEPAKPAAGETEEAGPRPIPASLAQALSEVATKAAAQVLAADPSLALPVLIASLRSYASPCRVRASGWPGLKPEAEISRLGSFRDKLSEASDGNPSIETLAAEVALTLDLTEGTRLRGEVGEGDRAALLDALDHDAWAAALAEHFSLRAYFGGAQKAHVLAAIKEAAPGKFADAPAKKEALVDFAVRVVEPTGWLPEQLRTRHYTGPGAAPAAEPLRKKPRRSRKAEALADAAE